MNFIIPLPDILAFATLLACWCGYTLLADRGGPHQRQLAKVMYLYRVQWMRQMLARDNRMPDVQIIANHTRGAILFASTSILILAGVVAVLGNIDRLHAIIDQLSFADLAARQTTEIKVLTLLGIFIYAFFKFAWCIRQFNYALIMIGAAPKTAECTETVLTDYPGQAAQVLARGSGSFNRGQRAYYFGLATLSWFIQPWLLVLAALGVLLILYRRDFRSVTLGALAEMDASGSSKPV